jgi:hypothetical protein
MDIAEKIFLNVVQSYPVGDGRLVEIYNGGKMFRPVRDGRISNNDFSTDVMCLTAQQLSGLKQPDYNQMKENMIYG